MRLKEINPGMVIHCKNDEEKKALLEEAERLGYLWANGDNPTKAFFPSNTLVFQEDGLMKNIYWTGDNENHTEFSDLILSELAAEETLRIFGAICAGDGCSRCPFDILKDDSDCPTFLLEHYKEAAEICAQWKYDHEKKEPEIETVDICRIIEIQQNGKKRCVHEEDINPELPFDTDKEVAEILKRYCMEHDGEFIAVHEVVSRVKR